jgi:hypothetical protein
VQPTFDGSLEHVVSNAYRTDTTEMTERVGFEPTIALFSPNRRLTSDQQKWETGRGPAALLTLTWRSTSTGDHFMLNRFAAGVQGVRLFEPEAGVGTPLSCDFIGRVGTSVLALTLGAVFLLTLTPVAQAERLDDPIEIGSIDTPELAQDVAVVGGYAYVADRDSGLRVILSVATAPIEVGFFETDGSTRDVSVVGDPSFPGPRLPVPTRKPSSQISNGPKIPRQVSTKSGVASGRRNRGITSRPTWRTPSSGTSRSLAQDFTLEIRNRRKWRH